MLYPVGHWLTIAIEAALPDEVGLIELRRTVDAQRRRVDQVHWDINNIGWRLGALKRRTYEPTIRRCVEFDPTRPVARNQSTPSLERRLLREGLPDLPDNRRRLHVISGKRDQPTDTRDENRLFLNHTSMDQVLAAMRMARGEEPHHSTVSVAFLQAIEWREAVREALLDCPIKDLLRDS